MSDPDLISRLREPDRYGQTFDDKIEAADEIERLRAALECISKNLHPTSSWCGCCDDIRKIIEEPSP